MWVRRLRKLRNLAVAGAEKNCGSLGCKIVSLRETSKMDALLRIENAYSAVVEYFPNRELAIRRLLKSDESFREICEELYDAKAALAKVTVPSDQLHAARRAEWHDIVGRLVAELLRALMAHDASFLKDRK